MLRILLATVILMAATPAAADPVHDATQRELPALLEFYRDFHTHPELGLHETRSAAILAAEARKGRLRRDRGRRRHRRGRGAAQRARARCC
ncbi:MAG: hypothetical protein WDN24_13655 [Sphingomonas sp.]